MQLIDPIPLIWNQKINDSKKCWNKLCRTRPSPNKNRVIVLDKLTGRKIYSVLLLSSGNTATSQKYFGKVFPNENFDWKKIYILPRALAIDSF